MVAAFFAVFRFHPYEDTEAVFDHIGHCDDVRKRARATKRPPNTRTVRQMFGQRRCTSETEAATKELSKINRGIVLRKVSL